MGLTAVDAAALHAGGNDSLKVASASIQGGELRAAESAGSPFLPSAVRRELAIGALFTDPSHELLDLRVLAKFVQRVERIGECAVAERGMDERMAGPAHDYLHFLTPAVGSWMKMMDVGQAFRHVPTTQGAPGCCVIGRQIVVDSLVHDEVENVADDAVHEEALARIFPAPSAPDMRGRQRRVYSHTPTAA